MCACASTPFFVDAVQFALLVHAHGFVGMSVSCVWRGARGTRERVASFLHVFFSRRSDVVGSKIKLTDDDDEKRVWFT